MSGVDGEFEEGASEDGVSAGMEAGEGGDDDPDEDGLLDDDSEEGSLSDLEDEDEGEIDDDPPRSLAPLVLDPDLLLDLSKPLTSEYKKAFKYFTTSRDRSHIAVESLPLLMRGLNKNPHPLQLAAWLKDLQIKPDGRIDAARFIHLMQQPGLAKVDSELQLREAFRAFDESETGYISEELLRSILTQVGESLLKPQEVDDFVKDALADSHGGKFQYLDFVQTLRGNVRPVIAAKKRRAPKKKRGR